MIMNMWLLLNVLGLFFRDIDEKEAAMELRNYILRHEELLMNTNLSTSLMDVLGQILGQENNDENK